jgi:septum formation protein
MRASTMPLTRSISRPQWSSSARTRSIPSSSATVVARATAGPTASCHANDVRAGDGGCRRRIPASTPVEKSWMASISSQVYIADWGRARADCRYDPAVPLVLASSSPRRAELLTSAGFDFVVIPADVDETPRSTERPPDYALRLAHAKADRVTPGLPPDCVVLAADTVVVSAGRLLGKPVDAADATSMLRTLSGSVHEVHTAVVVRGGLRKVNRVVTTRVRFVPLTEAEIEWYVASGEPYGKAGAYGIQGLAARFVDSIDGSWSNVVGLPISTVYRLLKEAGHPV